MHAKKQMNEILHLVTKLQAIITARDKQIESLFEEIDDLKQHTRRENIITSSKSRHMTYQRVSTQVDDTRNHRAPEEEIKRLEHQLNRFLNHKLELNLKPPDINQYNAIKETKYKTWSERCSLHVVALLDSSWIDKLHRLSLPTGKWAQLPFFGPASHWNPQSGWHYSY